MHQTACAFLENIGDRQIERRSVLDQECQSSSTGRSRWRGRTPQFHEPLELPRAKRGHDLLGATSKLRRSGSGSEKDESPEEKTARNDAREKHGRPRD
ncbi:MAG TPA: hypothetical protein VGK04_07395 [Thermoanaerobaculia bacterium]